MATVMCVNAECVAYQVACTVSSGMVLGEGEDVVCGSCGYPTRFDEGEESITRIPFNAETMNVAKPWGKFRAGRLPREE